MKEEKKNARKEKRDREKNREGRRKRRKAERNEEKKKKGSELMKHCWASRHLKETGCFSKQTLRNASAERHCFTCGLW